jgi:molybdopterin molybdotransferase
VDLGIAADRADALAERLAAAAGLDLLLTSGGASVGDHDVVGQALGAARTTGSTSGRSRCGPASRCCSGGPGAACACSACPATPSQPRLRAGVRAGSRQADARPRPGAAARGRGAGPGLAANDAREDYVRGRYVGRSPEGRRRVEPAERQDSSMFATFAAADALVVRPRHDPPRAEGAEVEVVDLRQAFLAPA